MHAGILHQLTDFAWNAKMWVLALPLLMAGCITPVDYGKIPHSEYIAPEQCNPLASETVDGDALPYFVVTSRLPNCLTENITLLHHRGEKLRYGRFATPQGDIAGKDDSIHSVPLSLVNETRWWADLASQMGAKEGRVLLYVHGYRETFFTTSRDTAQIARLTNFGGPVIQYSWPSQGQLLKYPVDETNMYWDERNFRKFLMRLARQDWTKEIILVSHSLGARLVLPSVEYVDQISTRTDSSIISNIILVSPDVDTQDFERDIAEELLSTQRVENGRRVTVYASAKDRALEVSSDLHGYPRLGYPRCFSPFEAAELEARDLPIRCYADHPEYAVTMSQSALTIVDTTAVSQGRTGHSNYLLSAPACQDFAAVVNGERSPSGRQSTYLDHVFRLPPIPKGEKPDHLAICRRKN
jgi:esterase/lipase superfamily enzyme